MLHFVKSRPALFSTTSLAQSLVYLGRKMSTNSYSLNALKRWSCSDSELPAVNQIKNIHVYDFDNTLFASPKPNKQLWQGSTLGMLQTQETLVTGGWWHDPNILKCTGEGIEVEEPRAWRGWWNEKIVELVELSTQQTDAVTILLTGRTEKGFSEIVQKMVKSKKLEFDMIVLRPEVGPSNEKFASTLKFKHSFFEALVRSYTEADDIRVYEDRPKHVQGFRDHFVQLNNTFLSEPPAIARKPIHAEVVEVAEESTNLDPVVECAEVQKAINVHNRAFREGALPGAAKSWEIKKTVFFTGYLIPPADTDRLLQAAGLPNRESNSSSGDIRTLANAILITPYPCPPHIMERVGGIGKKLRWRAVAFGNLDDQIFAAKVEPIPSTEQIYTANKVPTVVLALRGAGKPIQASRITQWDCLPDDKVIEFDTTVGERSLLKLEFERPAQNDQNRGFKRWRPQDEEFPPLGSSKLSSQPGRNDSRNQQTNAQKRNYHAGENRRQNGQSGQDGQRGGPRFGGGRVGGGQRNNFQRGRGGANDSKGRGRGGYPGYKSLDDEFRRQNNSFGADGANDGELSY